MKKLLFTCLLFSFIINVQSQEIKKVAVISISTNSSFDTDWRKGVEIKGWNIKELTVGTAQFSPSDQLTKYKNLLFDDLAKELPFALEEESKILNIEAYKEFDPHKENENLDGIEVSDGYRFHSKLMKKNIVEMFEFLPDDIDAVMIYAVGFSLRLDNIAANTGMGGAFANAGLLMEVYDREGSKILNVWDIESSKGKVKVKLNKVPEKEYIKIPGLINEASDNLYGGIMEKLPKKIDKMYKKLAKK